MAQPSFPPTAVPLSDFPGPLGRAHARRQTTATYVRLGLLGALPAVPCLLGGLFSLAGDHPAGNVLAMALLWIAIAFTAVVLVLRPRRRLLKAGYAIDGTVLYESTGARVRAYDLARAEVKINEWPVKEGRRIIGHLPSLWVKDRGVIAIGLADANIHSIRPAADRELLAGALDRTPHGRRTAHILRYPETWIPLPFPPHEYQG